MTDLPPLFKALADETRLAMMTLLFRHRELCVCDFVEVLSISQSKASRHLRYLSNAGLLEDRRAGQWVHYRIGAQPEPAVRDLLRAVEQTLAGQPYEALEQRLADWQDKKRQNGPSCSPPQQRRSSTARASSQRATQARTRTAKRRAPRGPRGATETTK